MAILVAPDVEALQYYFPLMRLQEEGATVLTAALELKPLHGKNGIPIVPDTVMESLRAEDILPRSFPVAGHPIRGAAILR